ncbi:MAG: DegT/DnrJ/EryC1/StrS family aminotransferase [Gemmataceae bacterium]
MSEPHDSRPALAGGTPIRPHGPPDWPPADADVRAALLAAFEDGSWGKYHGSYVDRLQEELTRRFSVPFALACGSGTYAVELALRALHLEPGDEVLLAAYDYAGNFLCVHEVGAVPVLVDLQPDNCNLDAGLLEEAISPRTRAVIVSHLHGGIVPMKPVLEVAGRHNLVVIEDAAQLPGATVDGQPAGSQGDIGILSFGGSKLLSAGRGGAMLTRRADLHQRARRHVLRGNLVCPLSELQAAVLLPQLDKLAERNELRTRAVAWLTQQLADMPGLRPFRNPAGQHAPGYYKVGFQFDAAAFGLNRDRFAAALRAEGIAMDAGFASLHRGRSASRFRAGGPLAQADLAHEGTVILHHPVLLGEEADWREVVEAIRKVHAHAGLLNSL